MFKFLVLLVLCNWLYLILCTFWFLHIAPQQSHTNLFICSVHYVKDFVDQFEWLIFVFEHCWCQHWWQIFLITKVFCCNSLLMPQPHELFEICLSHCQILDQAEVLLLVFLEHFNQINRFISFLVIVSLSREYSISFFDCFVQKVVVIRFFIFLCPENDSTVKSQLWYSKWFPVSIQSIQKQPSHSCKFIQNLYCEQKVLHCPLQRQDVLFTQLQISHFTAG